MNDLPCPEAGRDRISVTSKMSDDTLLDMFSTASLKRVMADTNSQEQAWEDYWYELREEIKRRIEE